MSFAGLINAADAIDGVYLDFPYRSRDPESGLNIRHPGCQLISGFQALAVARSRHFYYSLPRRRVAQGRQRAGRPGLRPPGWDYDGTSDYGRIDRQNAFLRAMLARVKGSLANPFEHSTASSEHPQGRRPSTAPGRFNEMIGLALKFHSLNPAAIKTYTLPTAPGTMGGADVLFVQQPAAQQMLVNIFGSAMIAPTNPPPQLLAADPDAAGDHPDDHDHLERTDDDGHGPDTHRR